jgi:hypothetical protein
MKIRARVRIVRAAYHRCFGPKFGREQPVRAKKQLRKTCVGALSASPFCDRFTFKKYPKQCDLGDSLLVWPRIRHNVKENQT